MVDNYSNNFYNLIATQTISFTIFDSNEHTYTFNNINVFNLLQNYSDLYFRIYTVSSNTNTSIGSTNDNMIGISTRSNQGHIAYSKITRNYYMDAIIDCQCLINLKSTGKNGYSISSCSCKCNDIMNNAGFYISNVDENYEIKKYYIDNSSGYNSSNPDGNADQTSVPVILFSIPGAYTFKCDVYASKILK